MNSIPVNGTISLFDSKTNKWEHQKRTEISNCVFTKSTEEMYINELRCFIDASVGKANYDHSIRDDHKILNLLYAAELSAKTGKNKVLLMIKYGVVIQARMGSKRCQEKSTFL